MIRLFASRKLLFLWGKGAEDKLLNLGTMYGTICLLGTPLPERLGISSVASEFGWRVEYAPDLEGLRMIGRERSLVAVLIDAANLGLPTHGVLGKVLETAPDALPIVCHKPCEPIAWPELAERGAFHALLSPLCDSEVRQSLGFVREAQKRRRAPIVITPHPVSRVMIA